MQILKRGVPIARLVGLPDVMETTDKARVDRLVDSGILRRGSGDLTWLLREPRPSLPDAGVSEALEEDRGDRI